MFKLAMSATIRIIDFLIIPLVYEL